MSNDALLVMAGTYLGFGLGNFRSEFILRWRLSSELLHYALAVCWYAAGVALPFVLLALAHKREKQMMDSVIKQVQR